MRNNFWIVILLFPIMLFAQTPKPAAPPRRAEKDLYHADHDQYIVNNQYFTINRYYNSKLTKKDNAIAAREGFFKKGKKTKGRWPFLKFGGMAGMAMGHFLTIQGNPVDPFNAKIIDGRINMDAVLRDSKGNEYARITDRLWEISSPDNIEYNNDSTAFEVRTGKRVVFQMEIVRDTIFFYGMLCSENGNCIYGSQNDTAFTPLRSSDPHPQRFILPSDLKADPIFKYPRSQYLGVRNPARKPFQLGWRF